jgi:hypothetical protein
MTSSSPKCLLDASVFVHVFMISFDIFIVWACWSAFIFSFEDIQLLLFGFWFIFCQLDGQECLGPLFSYLCFLTSYSIHAASQNLNKYFSIPLCVEHSEFRIDEDWPLKPPKCFSVEPTPKSRSHRMPRVDLVFILGNTDFIFSVTPSFPVSWQLWNSVTPKT